MEFALALPLLILLLVGIFDFGRAIYVSSTISNAARAGNRVAIVDQKVIVVKDVVVAQAVAVGLAPSDVTLAVACQQIGCLSTVTVDIQYQPATPIINALVGTIDLHATSEMPIERVYQSP